MKRSLGLAVLVAATLVAACGGGGSGPDAAASLAGGRLGSMAIAANPRSIPTPQVQDFTDAFNLSQLAGARSTVVTYTWSALEPQPGVYALQDLRNATALARNSAKR